MPKKIENQIERVAEEYQGALGDIEDSQNEVVAKVEPVKRKRVMSEEQRAKQAENLRRGREALQAKREASVKERAQMLHDAAVDVAPKAKKEDLKMKRILEAVGSIASTAADKEEETDEEIVVVKKRAPKKRVIVVQEEEEEQPPPPPPPSTPKVKRTYKKREPANGERSSKVEQQEPVAIPMNRPSIIFY